jgi:ubiquinone/menaquinone biosynthesis C-methylase UbiE
MQENESVINLLPMDLLQDKNFDTWNERQQMYFCWYKNIWNKRLGIQSKYLYDEYSNYIGRVNGLTLDIGCGSGNFKAYLKEAIYVGIDPLDYMDYNCNFRDELFPFDENECIFIKGIGELLPFENEAFNNVFINNTLDHTYRPQEVLNEAYRVLKSKGKLLIVHEDISLARKIFTKGIKGIFYSFIDKALTLFLSRSITMPHKRIRKDELMEWLTSKFTFKSRNSYGASHIYICAIKE